MQRMISVWKFRFVYWLIGFCLWRKCRLAFCLLQSTHSAPLIIVIVVRALHTYICNIFNKIGPVSAIGPLYCAFAGDFEFIYRSHQKKKNRTKKKAFKPMRCEKEFQYFSLLFSPATYVFGVTLITPLHATHHTAIYLSAIDSNSCRNAVRTFAAYDMAAIATHNRVTHTQLIHVARKWAKKNRRAVTKMRNENEK